MHIRLRATHCGGKIATKRELRSKRSRKRTTSAMSGNGICNPRHRKLLKRLSVKKNINRRRSRTMTALHKHGTTKLFVKPGCKLPRMGRICRATFSRIYCNAAKRLGLGQVRRDKRGKRKKSLRENRNCIVGHEPRPARRNHHRVYHLCNLRMRGKPTGDYFNGRRVSKHTRLERANIIDTKNCIELRSDKVGRNSVNCRDAMRVLRRKRGKDSAAVKIVGVESAKIGLDAGVATGIASGNGKATRRYCTVHDVYYITQRQRSGRRFRR